MPGPTSVIIVMVGMAARAARMGHAQRLLGLRAAIGLTHISERQRSEPTHREAHLPQSPLTQPQCRILGLADLREVASVPSIADEKAQARTVSLETRAAQPPGAGGIAAFGRLQRHETEIADPDRGVQARGMRAAALVFGVAFEREIAPDPAPVAALGQQRAVAGARERVVLAHTAQIERILAQSG